jgi:hypothetical protein
VPRFFLCWVPDRGEGPDDGELRLCWDEAAAAEEHAKEQFDGEPFSSIDIMVRSPDGITGVYEVEVDYDPTFSARPQLVFASMPAAMRAARALAFRGRVKAQS